MKYIYVSFIALFLLVPSLAWGQIYSGSYDETKVIKNRIAPMIHEKYGAQYDFAYTVFDTLIQYSIKWNDGRVEDPYGTLKGCILFSVIIPSHYDEQYELEVPQDTNIVGMIKDGRIIWDNYPGEIKSCAGLLYAQDLNNDGEVDLVFYETSKTSLKLNRTGPFLSYLHILSWNGTRGRFISADMEGCDHDYYPIDIDGDGIMEIRASLPKEIEASDEFKTSTYPLVTYGWNGSQYGLWPGVRQIKTEEFLPANRMKVKIKCLMEKQNVNYKYLYTVSNDSTSKQKISVIYIGGLDDTSEYQAPTYWGAGSGYIGGRVFVEYLPHKEYLINPGKSLSGFITTSTSLPTIVKYYAQGYNYIVAFGTDEQKRLDIYNNSVTGFTIGTRDTSIAVDSLSFLDTLTSFTTRLHNLDWIKQQSTADKYLNYFSTAKSNIQQNRIQSARSILGNVLHDVDIDSSSTLTSEAYALLRYNTEYLLNKLPVIPPSGCSVKLVNSTGAKLTTGALQYYESSWKDAVNNNDGTFTIATNQKTISLRMTYEYGMQTKSNVIVGSDTVVFQTVDIQIKLQDSQDAAIDTGTVQYYAGAWRAFGTTTNGVTSKELLPANYSFRMMYASASNDKQQDISTNPIVIFKTVNAVVQLQNSQGALMSAEGGQGTVRFYAGAWRDFGSTLNGVATKELLPNKYSFRMTYAFASKDKQQDLNTNSVVVFQTVNANVQLQNSLGNPMDQGTVQYYAGAWRDFGTTSNGVAIKELLPNNYSFRMTYAFASRDKQQDLTTNPVVVFQTVNANVQLQNSLGNLIDQGIVQYYSGAWRDFGGTTGGTARKELLPNNYSFRMSYANSSKDLQQNIGTNPTVVFKTVNATVQLLNSQSTPIDQGTVQYYAGAWRQFGTTSNGVAAKELLPNSYSFRMTHEYVSLDKAQDISTNNTVSFSAVLCTIRVKNSQNQPVNNALASYYAGSWRQIGTTVNGEITKELLPVNLSFRIKSGTTQLDKTQNLSTNNVVEFTVQP